MTVSSIVRKIGTAAVLLVLANFGTAHAVTAGQTSDRVKQVAVGYGQTCALTEVGNVWCWGAEKVNGTGKRRALPRLVKGLGDITAITAGQLNSCGLDVDGSVWCWGLDLQESVRSGREIASATPRRIARLPPAARIAAGYLHVCAIARRDGSVWCWGGNAAGELGNGDTRDSAEPVRAGRLEGALDIATGVNNSCAAVSGGQVWCWGTDLQSDLGGQIIKSTLPQPVDLPDHIDALANGRNFVCGLTNERQAVCFGSNVMMQLGSSAAGKTYTRAAPDGIDTALAIGAGLFSACALLPSGKVSCWGVPIGQTDYSFEGKPPGEVPGLDGVTNLAVGAETACAILASGSVKCWGNNADGQVGNGQFSTDPVTMPADVIGLPGSDPFVTAFGLAKARFGDARYKEALTRADEALRLRPDDAEALYLRGLIKQASGRKAAALQDFTAAIAGNTKFGDALRQRATLLLEQGDTSGAIADLNRALEIDEKDALALVERGKILFSLGENARAERDFAAGLRADPEVAGYYVDRGNAYTQHKQTSLALRDFDLAIRLDPRSIPAFEGRALAYAAKGDRARAARDRAQAKKLQNDEDTADTLRQEADTAFDSGDYSKAITKYSEALVLSPRNKYAFWRRAMAYQETEQWELAIADFTRALALDPADASSYFYRGLANFSLGNLDEAIADLTRSIDIAPDAYSYQTRAVLYRDKGDTGSALADYGNAIAISPRHANVWQGRGWLYLWSGQTELALPDLRTAHELDPDFAYTLLWLDIAERRLKLTRALVQRMKTIDMTAWPAPIIRFYAEEISFTDLLKASENSDADVQRDRTCEATYYGAEQALVAERREEAIALFRIAEDICPRQFAEWNAAHGELERLRLPP